MRRDQIRTISAKTFCLPSPLGQTSSQGTCRSSGLLVLAGILTSFLSDVVRWRPTRLHRWIRSLQVCSESFGLMTGSSPSSYVTFARFYKQDLAQYRPRLVVHVWEISAAERILVRLSQE